MIAGAGVIVDMDSASCPLAESRRLIDRFFESATDHLDVLKEKTWSQILKDLFEKFRDVEDFGHWPEPRIWWICEIELDVVADYVDVVAEF